MSLDSRSPKRRRVSSNPRTIVILSPGQPLPIYKAGQQRFTRHADFWLDDGNLILTAGNMAFRVYQGLLTKASPVFTKMFATGSAEATETFDGCPVVSLPHHPKDLRDFLQYLMPCSRHTLRRGLPAFDFTELYAAFHLAHEYECLEVETRVLSVLKRFYAPHYTRQSLFDAPEGFFSRPSKSDAIAAVKIARLTETPSMLPFALYEVCTLEERIVDGYKRRDGSVEHLSPEDLRLCLRVRRELAKHLAFFIRDVFQSGPSAECESPLHCSEGLNSICDEVQVDVLGDCHIFDFGMGEVRLRLCKGCAAWVQQREEAERKRVWGMLPYMFGMTAKECGFSNEDEPLQY